MIKLTMNLQDFKRVMREMDTYANNFTDEGLKILFEYLEDLDGVIEMDVPRLLDIIQYTSRGLPHQNWRETTYHACMK
jgi:hypothetical protein